TVKGRPLHALHFDYVVWGATVITVPIFVASIFVASMSPFADESAPALGALMPVAFARRGPAHNQFSDFIWTELPPCLVNNAHLVTGHRLPGRPIADVAWPVAQKGLQHFGRAEAIKHVDPDSIAPTLADMGGQRLACRHADAQPVGASATANVLMRKESGIE